MTSQRILYSALFGISLMGFLTIPAQVIELAIEQPERDSPYFIAPGNRSACDLWIAHQSDSSRNPFIVHCVMVKT